MKGSEKPFSKSSYFLQEGKLRLLEKKEAPLIAETLVSMEPWVTLQYSKESLTSHLQGDDPSLKRFIILFDDQVAGVVCVRNPWLLGPYLEIIGLFKAFQGAGHGTEVLRWLKNEAFSSSRNLWTLVSSFNETAMRFYESFGFEQVVSLPGFVRPGFDEILLRIQKEKTP